ncbi:hypothetical protein Celaphus_00017265 [Cervus elaphus hippelaphus]|uniref:Uncharacterized protein n=1 Tax=Cervus elaphus hippelaphus TaxID=46360 RepID=A0A212D6E5_CEREH|nr:hypothetical protein Celaphus_00017265 [Cervus elaphus hippelaphus]
MRFTVFQSSHSCGLVNGPSLTDFTGMGSPPSHILLRMAGTLPCNSPSLGKDSNPLLRPCCTVCGYELPGSGRHTSSGPG